MSNIFVLGENGIKINKIIIISISNNKNDKKYNEILDLTIIEIDDNQDNFHDYIELDFDIINLMKLNKKEIMVGYENIHYTYE